MGKLFKNWDDNKKLIITSIIVLLLIVIFGLIIYHFNYRSDCVPNNKLNECIGSLNSTNHQLLVKDDENSLLKSEIKELTNSSSQCSGNLKQCREDLDKLNQSYNELLERFNQLNKSCQKQSVFICPEDKKINETFKSNPQEPNRGTHFEYSFIALILIIIILPFVITKI